MKFYKNLGEFVTAARSGTALISNSRSFSAETWQSVSKIASVEVPQEGLSALLTGSHLYTMLQLKPGLTTSSNNEDRQKTITLLADLVQGVREIAHQYEGALLEAQGPVVHVLLPDDSEGAPRDARKAAVEILEFINQRIKHRAGTDFRKALVAYSHGPTILVSAASIHLDDSVVSLAPAANAPAKVLWQKWETLPSGTILEVQPDLKYRAIPADAIEVEVMKSAAMIANSSRHFEDVMLLEARAAEMPAADSPDSPTVLEPHKSYSVSFRADIEGFTQKVQDAADAGEEAMQELAEEFYGIMDHARRFCRSDECIHLPWAGDCFNLLLSFEDRESYNEARSRRILTTALRFRDHMQELYPELEWSFSSAGGSLESAQACNTLVSRLTVGHTTLLLATGLPVERSLQGLVEESPDADRGVLWKGDVAALDPDLQEVLDPSPGGANYRHFGLDDVEEAEDEFDFRPAPPVYTSPVVQKNVSIIVPTAKPHSPRP